MEETDDAVRTRTLHVWGRTEAELSALLAGRLAERPVTGRPGVTLQADETGGARVRIVALAGGATGAEAETLLADEERRLRAILGALVFAVDGGTMEATVIHELKRRGLTLAVAESLTGGLVGARLTAVPGASAVFRGAVVAYASEIKCKLLDVPPGPVVSAATARAMALGVARLLGADIGLATTGVAGPDRQEGQPVGTVFLGLALNGRGETRRLRLPGRRDTVRQLTVTHLLNLLRLRLRDLPPAAR